LARSAQHLSNIVWAYATLGHKSALLFSAVAGEHKRIAEHGTTQELANTCWAFASNGFKSDALFSAVAGQHARIAKEGKEQVSERSERAL